jgi:site-specific DNA-methyltransferase (adenine-specific)
VSAAPYYASDRATLYGADALVVLASLPDASVDAVITDPPYSSGGTFRGDRTIDTRQKYVPTKEVVNFHPGFSGDNRDQRSYGYWSALWLSECLRIAKPGAPICLFTDWRQLPTTTDALQAGGWVWRGVVVWDKTPGARPNAGRFRQQAEFIAWGSSGPMPVDLAAPCLNGVFTHAPFRGKEHIAGKPFGLMRDLAKICPPGGVILDPFMGSGTTGMAAIAGGCSFIGIDHDPHSQAKARERVVAAQVGYRDDGKQFPLPLMDEAAPA